MYFQYKLFKLFLVRFKFTITIFDIICLICQNLLSFIIFYSRNSSRPDLCLDDNVQPQLPHCSSLPCSHALQLRSNPGRHFGVGKNVQLSRVKYHTDKRPWSLKLDKKYFYIMINSRTSYVYIII